jgi:hypothetical protein
MHPHFEFPVRQVLWTLTFAAQLVLLVVLLGRDRARRYPWFTAGIALAALRLMAEILLAGRMATLPLQEILLPLADLAAVVGLLVLIELARRAFSGFRRMMRSLARPWQWLWFAIVLGLWSVASSVVVGWGPWPARSNLALDTLLGKLRLMQLLAQKGDLLVALLTVELGLLVVLFGRRFKAGWRSHAQMIAIGLSTVAISLLALQATVMSIVRTAHTHSQQEYERIVGLVTNLVNANKLVYLCALVWWIVWLWLDEPGATAVAATEEKG